MTKFQKAGTILMILGGVGGVANFIRLYNIVGRCLPDDHSCGDRLLSHWALFGKLFGGLFVIGLLLIVYGVVAAKRRSRPRS
jgi:hypothetical protein